MTHSENASPSWPPDSARVRDTVEHHLPGVRVRSIAALGSGLDHRVYAVNDDLVIRLARHLDPERVLLMRREHDLLRFLADWSPIAVPRPLWCEPEAGILALEKLPGTPMIELPPIERSALAVPVAVELGSLLAALHALAPGHPLVAGAVVDDTTPSARLTEAAQLYAEVAPHLQPGARNAVESFLCTPPPTPASPAVLSHNDLGIEHVLIDPLSGRICGVIDWTDAAVVDPARDVGLILRDLGPIALSSAVTAYGADSATKARLLDRAGFYARCGAIEDLAYSLTAGGRSYLEKSHTSLTWLFPRS